MNNRDPFNIRKTSPLAFISGASSPIVSTRDHSPQLDRNSVRPRNAETQSSDPNNRPDTGMSHVRHVQANSYLPDSNVPQPYSDSQWQHRRNPPPSQASQLKEKFADVFQSKDELPLYKDKPYGHSGQRKRLPLSKGQRVVLGIVGFLLLCLYWGGYLPGFRGSSRPRSTGGRRTSGPGLKRTGLGLFPGSGVVDWDARREAVRDAFKASWEAYERNAWGKDEFHPVSKSGRQMVPNGMGWIIVDALDTLMIMNLTTPLTHARSWIQHDLNYEQDHDVNTFETTIRMLGGFLSAHYLSTTFPDMAPLPSGAPSSEDLYLEKASELADRLMGAYTSKSGIPYASFNLKTRQGIPSHADGGASSTAEATSVQLEMKYLSHLTGETSFWVAAEKAMQVVDDNGMKDGLVPIYIHPDDGKFRGQNIRLGSRGDSYYEYLIKQYLQTSEQEPVYKELWDQALAGVKKHLVTYTKFDNLTIIAERPNGLLHPLRPKMDHLVCFMPGTIALAATRGKTLKEARVSAGWSTTSDEDIELARQLTKTCMGMYKVTKTGLAPEIAHFMIHDPPIMSENKQAHSEPDFARAKDSSWRRDYDIHSADFHNLQRPETIESLLYMWRITGDEMYRRWGWEIFEAFMSHTHVPGGGYASIDNVDSIPPPLRDNMESFWLAETLKYLYLLFGPDDVLPFDKVVFNTEAHPFPKFELGKLFSTGWKRLPRDADGNIVHS